MALFLQALGAMVLAVVVLVALALGYLAFRLARTVAHMKRLAGMMGGPVAPVRIHLEDAPGFPWRDPGAVERLQAEFAAAGFRAAGRFAVREVPNVGMVAFAREDGTAYGTITEHPATGLFAEVFRAFEGGATHTVTQAKALDDNPSAPHKTMLRRPGSSVAQLVRDLDAIPAEGRAAEHPPEGFQERFEAAYHRDLVWAYTEGPLKGTDLDTVVGFVGQSGDPETESFLRGLEAEDDVETRVREAFLAGTSLSAAEWEAIRDEAVFVHDGLSDRELAELVLDDLDDEMDAYSAANDLVGDTPRQRFVDLLRRLELTHAFTRVGSVEEPLACDVYRHPAFEP